EVGFPPGRVRVIRNGVSLPSRARLVAERRRARTSLGIAGDEPWAVFVGRLTREKGADVLLRALETPVGLGGLLVVGDGPERNALEALATRVSLSVRFCGYHEDVSRFLAAADLFVQPSRSEGLPFSLLEAMAHGLAVVCSDVGGMGTAVGGGGRGGPPEDPPARAASLRGIARHREARRAPRAAPRPRGA